VGEARARHNTMERILPDPEITPVTSCNFNDWEIIKDFYLVIIPITSIRKFKIRG
jgi:hypothetical protein